MYHDFMHNASTLCVKFLGSIYTFSRLLIRGSIKGLGHKGLSSQNLIQASFTYLKNLLIRGLIKGFSSN